MYENAVGKHNLDALEAFGDRSLHEFGFTVEMLPTQQQMGQLTRVQLAMTHKANMAELQYEHGGAIR